MNDLSHDFVSGTEEAAATRTSLRMAARRKLFVALGCGVALAAAGVATYGQVIASKHVVTDNAYVGADVAWITPLVGGPVREVLAQDTRHVRRGDVLVRLDDTDARLAVDRTRAQLAATIRRVRGLVANDTGLAAQVVARRADEQHADARLAAARSAFAKARLDLARREALADSGAVSGDELTAVRNAHAAALADLRSAEAARTQAAATRNAAIGSREANRALIADASIDDNPEVLAARAAHAKALVDLERTVIRAPVDGVVSRRQVQVGQQVQPGTMMMLVVPIEAAYVDANFKEVQLAKVRTGQPVELTSDLYGKDVVFHGRVVGFSGGTGAAFALVPAQNATGNWIKVVQRLPVRIALDPAQLARHPLRVGLSMKADIRVAD